MDTTYKIIALTIYFGAMLAIGLFAFRRTNDGDDYMLGGRRLGPFTAAMSAGASDMSGWLLMGLPGALYMSGLVESWIAIGLLIGAAVNWLFIAPRLREYTALAKNSITIPSFFENRVDDRSRALRVAAGLVTLVFFTFYVASGMVAGGTYFESTFGGNYMLGMFLVAGVTLAYTLFGGFLGATYTDMVQGLIMLASLILVPLIAMFAVGGPGEMFDTVSQIKPEFTSLTASATFIGVVSSLAWGLGYFGQPHIIVRFMALRSSKDAKVGTVIGIGWMLLCVLGAIFTALAGLAYFQKHKDAHLTDTKKGETVFLDLAQQVFHPAVAGFLLAAVLAAIMSTISSQLVVTSSALVEDLAGIRQSRPMTANQQLWAGRAGVGIVAVVAMLLAMQRNDSILELVAFAWAGFGSAFGPLVLLSLFWRRLNRQGALAGLVTGAVVSFVWGKFELDTKWGLFGDQHLYEMVPGFLLGLLAAIVVSLVTPAPSKEVTDTYDEMLRLHRSPRTDEELAARA